MYRFALIATFLSTLLLVTPVAAGPFAPHTTSGVAVGDVAAWATGIANYAPTGEVVEFDSFGGGPHNRPHLGLGVADGRTVSLGDLAADAIAAGAAVGTITVEFRASVFDGPGPDLAVFENAGAFFNAFDPDFIFGELAFVEVSSNGTDFARFPATSLNEEVDPNVADPEHNQLHAPFGRDFAGVNTTNINNLAGIHGTLTGTPFDLADLASHPLVTAGTVDLADVHFVRLVDIPGDGSVLDSLDNPVLDAWHTTESGGLDLDAVGALNAVPEPASVIFLLTALGMAVGCRQRLGLFNW